MEHYDYIGEVLPEGTLSISPSLSRKLFPGQKIKVRIERIPDASQTARNKELDPATLRLLDRMKNAPRLGVIQGELRREDIYGERIDERY